MYDNSWKYTLNEYIRQGEPAAAEKSAIWKTAIGLQDVDGLKTSDYLLKTAQQHIEGEISISEVEYRIKRYYEERNIRTEKEINEKEADYVSSRIARILGENTFQFSPIELKSIHKVLFTGVFEHAGSFRDYNISKKEWVLNGNSVIYASNESISETLDYDFNQERNFSYRNLSEEQLVKHISRFVSGIWQIHPFGEGNTRTTAVFIIKYLRTLGFSVNNELFESNSWYFRNALVRANYNDWNNNIYENTEYLEKFFENLLFGKSNELSNRNLHIDFEKIES